MQRPFDVESPGALSESFETLFARSEKPAGNELFLWPRGHAPSAWAPTKKPLDADARDLAASVVIAARASPGGKVELALHSYAALVFQRMIQLHAEPAVSAALKALVDSRVFLLHATTHYEGLDQSLGPEFVRIVKATRSIVDFLNIGDATSEMWQAAARLNPFLTPAITAAIKQWRFLRGQILEFAVRDAVTMMRADLKVPWDQAVDHIRRSFLENLKRDARDPGWQEALIRRSDDAFHIDFAPNDTARINRLGIRLELVNSDGDKLLSWESTRALFVRLGISAPDSASRTSRAACRRRG